MMGTFWLYDPKIGIVGNSQDRDVVDADLSCIFGGALELRFEGATLLDELELLYFQFDVVRMDTFVVIGNRVSDL